MPTKRRGRVRLQPLGFAFPLVRKIMHFLSAGAKAPIFVAAQNGTAEAVPFPKPSCAQLVKYKVAFIPAIKTIELPAKTGGSKLSSPAQRDRL
jgi:hypothetical protein